ncbi:MAG: tetratricopeptide repeat protein [Chloroflexi bacterium]|nr:tetratricopeptide repeat protein [Chloroflexota bacterium]
MSDANQLDRAYQLIEADNLSEARAILGPLVAQEPNNADAWWLYAHALDDPGQARSALQNVLRINPDYPEARSLLETLNTQFGGLAAPAALPAAPPPLTQPPVQGIKPLSTSAPKPAEDDVPDFSDEEPIDFDEPEEEETPAASSRPRWLMLLVAVLAMIGIIVVGLFIVALLNPPGTVPTSATAATEGSTVALATETPTEEVTEAAVIETSEATETQEVEATAAEEPTPTVEPTQGETAVAEASPTPEEELAATSEIDLGVGGGGTPEELIGEALVDFAVPENPVEVVETSLGRTLLAIVCAAPEQVRQTAIDAMIAIAQVSLSVSDIDALAVRTDNCEQGTQGRLIGVTLTDAQDFANGTLDANEFQVRWQPAS